MPSAVFDFTAWYSLHLPLGGRGHAIVHDTFAAIARRYTSELNKPFMPAARTVRNVGDNKVLKIRVADQYEPLRSDQTVKIGAGIITGIYTSGEDRETEGNCGY